MSTPKKPKAPKTTRTITRTIDGVTVSIEVDAALLARRDEDNARMRAAWKAIDERGDWSLLRQINADMEADLARIAAAYAPIHAARYGHQRGAKRTAEQRQRIADGAKRSSARKPRDTRGRFAR